jgi:hypothetical protein
MLIVRLDNNGFNKAVVRHFVMLSACNTSLCDNTHAIIPDGDKTGVSEKPTAIPTVIAAAAGCNRLWRLG